jgi:hypothetical protein
VERLGIKSTEAPRRRTPVFKVRILDNNEDSSHFFSVSMPNNGMQGMNMQNNMMNNGAMMNNGMGGGMGAQQNMMRPQQPQVSVAL